MTNNEDFNDKKRGLIIRTILLVFIYITGIITITLMFVFKRPASAGLVAPFSIGYLWYTYHLKNTKRFISYSDYFKEIRNKKNCKNEEHNLEGKNLDEDKEPIINNEKQTTEIIEKENNNNVVSESKNNQNDK
ncbi:hypothetical protein [[Mycoplasma] gypis]|uniref:Uncharacterized protein n=1 Tax=[Mycoplasma] gypis TaxID=92404 RepID=A0ABZ2RPY8_9BACT|nr:hypothetical protein [[Mycoplasma] gypis]MBN0919672.1 hypothetical protein [[Mycoplasma] gypis]